MTEAELKLTLFRWIDQLSGDHLHKLVEFMGKNVEKPVEPVLDYQDDLEAGYIAMAADTEREAEAMEWVEGVLNHEEL